MKIPNFLNKCKTIFLERMRQTLTLLKELSPCIWICYKFVWKCVKSLNRVLWATKYWFKALKWQIWLTNTKPFFCISEANVETLQKLSIYIWVSYKFVMKSVNSLNWISWATECWFKALKCQYWSTNQNHFSGKAKQTLKLSKNFLPIFEVSISLC